jgi:hypothetical protein
MSAIVLLLLAASSKPVCNAAHQGRYWPEAANGSRQALRELYQSGALELCSAGEWKYKWMPLSVHVTRLGRKRR